MKAQSATHASPSADITQRLVEIIGSVGFESLTDAVISAARRILLDGLAVAVAGARVEAAPRILADYLRDQGTKPVASALGFDFRLSPAHAALLNGASMHVLDYEPMWSPTTHMVSPTLPVVLALAEMRELSGREVLTGLVKGIEIQGWLRTAPGHQPSRDVIFHPPGVVGPIGAAVAGSHLLGLEGPVLANAIGIAASRSGGILRNIGTMTKSTHCGYAASLGLEAALLAERGFTGNTEIFDGEMNFGDAFFPNGFDFDVLLNFGKPYRIVDPGFAIKMYPSKYTTHYGIVAGKALHAGLGVPERIRAVRIIAPPILSSDRPKPRTGLDGKFSMQFTAAAAILDGDVTLGTFTDERLMRPDMQTLLPKISLKLDHEISTEFSGRYVELEVELDDGTLLRERCDGPPGSWKGRPISDAEHLSKVRDCLVPLTGDERCEEVIALVGRVETLESADVRRLIQLASPRS